MIVKSKLPQEEASTYHFMELLGAFKLAKKSAMQVLPSERLLRQALMPQPSLFKISTSQS